MVDLLEIAQKHDTDKVQHGYIPHYESRFDRQRYSDITLLEIGVGGYDDMLTGGHSLRMWREYFTNGKIIGLDINLKDPQIAPGCEIVQGDQSDPRTLQKLIDDYGPFDIVIDDGSHRPNDIMQSWVVLWDALKDEAWYVIEDLQTSYWSSFGGSSVRTGDTVIGFLQGLIDRIHYAEFDIPGYNPNRFDLSVVGLEIARNIAFLRKGDNSAPSLWMPPHPHPKMFNDDVQEEV